MMFGTLSSNTVEIKGVQAKDMDSNVQAVEPRTFAEADALLANLGSKVNEAWAAYIGACDAHARAKRIRADIEAKDRAQRGIC
ncbi:hypothetical protein [Paraburkholderia azotifigens]|uniref:Uncharacterized protein n=1 Tax=Paraburkholderia azotifigens TaxID=2057004 RepID=A0A5C6VPG1_9BURK|nr:hypothetical protein [Paraburkholderia azotifigens]TXC86446.1 hypothetical protein FRZ40_01955 [Paraburkholderia azotifigens]